jgi:Zn-dependent protease/predicted transcriptional regulator
MNEREPARNRGLLDPTVSVGRIAGVTVGLNWSWLIIFILIVWSLARSYFPSRYPFMSGGAYFWMGVAAAILFFGSLLLHELGHALQARREGVQIDGITLWLFGGVARFKGMFPTPGAEFRIAIAGPLVTLGLSGAFIVLAALVPSSHALHGVLAWVGYVNLLLLVFNLMPALPLDGGRVLRSILWRAKGNFSWATAIAGGIGRAFGFLLIGGGAVLVIFYGTFSAAWFAVVGWFLLRAAEAERQYGTARQALGGFRVRDLMVLNPVTADPDETVAAFMSETAGARRHALYPVVRDGQLVGVLPFGRVAHIPRDEWPRQAVSECMLPPAVLPVLSEDEDLMDALTELSDADRRRGIVLRDGRFVGLLSLTDIERVLAELPRTKGGTPPEPRPRSPRVSGSS